MHLGFDVSALLPKADVVLVLESAVPWIPRAVTPKRDAKVIHIAADPLESKYPFREFETDLLITGEASATLPVLRAALRAAIKKGNGVDTRRKALGLARDEMEAKRREIPRQRARRDADPSGLHRVLPQRAQGGERDHRQRARPAGEPAQSHPAALLFRRPPVRRPRLRPRRRARRQAGGARARGDRDRRRRLVHVRQSAAVPLCRPLREPRDADHHLPTTRPGSR